MKPNSSQQLADLLTLAETRPLTEAEHIMLRNLLNDENNRLVASAHHHLQSHYQIEPEKTLSADELNSIITSIDQSLSKKVGQKAKRRNLQTFAWATAVILIGLFFVLIRPLQSPVPLEPVIVPTNTPTPMPTPTLRPNYVYSDLINTPIQNVAEYSASYPLSVSEAMSLWEQDLYLPVQTLDNWEFIGAAVNQEVETFEIAFIQRSRGSEFFWVLTQSPSNGRSIESPLPVSYQPLSQIDVTNIYADESIRVGQIEAHAQQYELVHQIDGRAEWIVYNTVTWQIDQQLFTLSMPSDALGSMYLIATLADLLQLQIASSHAP